MRSINPLSSLSVKARALLVAGIVGAATISQVLPALAVNDPQLTASTPANGVAVKPSAVSLILTTWDRALKAPTTGPNDSSWIDLQDAVHTHLSCVQGFYPDNTHLGCRLPSGTVLVDGLYTVTATAYPEPVGDPTVATFTFTVDGAAPPKPVVGSPSANALTNAEPVHVTGTAERGSTVAASEGGSQLASAVANASGAYDIPVPLGAEDGVAHTLSVFATDPAGNTGSDASISFTHDDVAPAPATLDTPASDTLTSSTSVTLSGTAPDGDVVLYDTKPSTPVQRAKVTATGGAWTATLSGLTDGECDIVARSRDTAGNLAAPSVTRAITVDSTAPAVPTIAIDNGPGINAKNELDTTVRTVAEAGSALHLSIDDANPATAAIASAATAAGDGTYAFSGLDLSGLDEGPLAFALTSTDAAGNSTTTNAMVGKDTHAPAAISTVGFDTDKIAAANQHSITVSGTGGEAGSQAVLTLTGGDNATLAEAPATIANDGTFAIPFDATSLADGAITASVLVRDAAGNESDALTANATKDATAPAAPAISTPNKDGLTMSSATVAFAGTAENGARVTVAEGTSELATTVADASTGAWNTGVSVAGDGVHTIVVHATDAYGNVGPDATRSFNVDTNAPALSSVSPVDGSVVQNLATVTATYGEPLADATLEVRNSIGNVIAGTTSISGSAIIWTRTGSMNDAGSPYTAKTTGTDSAGNVSGASSAGYTIDTVAPGAPVITAPAAGAHVPTASVIVAGTAEPNSTIAITEGSTTVGAATADGSGNWSTTSSFQSGDHSIAVTASDRAGNVSAAATRAFTETADTVPPGAPTITSPVASAVINNTSISFAGTAEPNSTVKVYESTTQIAQGKTDLSGAWSALATLAVGVHTVRATATDPAGNTGTASANRSFTVTNDTQAPAAPSIVAPAAGSSNGPTVTFNGTAEAGSTVKILEGGAILATATADRNGAWSVQHTMTDGSHSITATATDAAGNAGPATNAVAFTVDATPPVVTFSTQDSHVFAPTDPVTIEGGATDNMNVAGVELIFRDARGNKTSTIQATLTGAGTTTAAWTATASLLPGRYTVQATAIDWKGLRSPTKSITIVTLSVA